MTIKELIAEVKNLTSKFEEFTKTFSELKSVSGISFDEITIDELHKLAIQYDIPNCGDSD
jgi:hypothetical protein